MIKTAILLPVAIIALVLGGIGYITQDFHSQPNSDSNMPTSTSIASTSYTGNGKTVLASDYNYDINTGDLTSARDNKVVYTFSTGHSPDKFTGMPAVYIFSFLDESKLILWQTDSDSSQLGPDWEYKLWLGNELQYLDLDNLPSGLQHYVVPESKKQAARDMLASN